MPKVAILDESTSALDPENEDLLYQTLRSLKIHFVSVGHRSQLKACPANAQDLVPRHASHLLFGQYVSVHIRLLHPAHAALVFLLTQCFQVLQDEHRGRRYVRCIQRHSERLRQVYFTSAQCHMAPNKFEFIGICKHRRVIYQTFVVWLCHRVFDDHHVWIFDI